MNTSAVERCPWCGSPITHAKFLKVQAAIREDERKKLADTEKLIQQRLLKERQALDAENAKIAKQLELAKQQAELQRKRELAEMRKILEKDRENALLKRNAEFAREREALQKKIVEMSRRVKKGGDVGEGA